MAKIHPKSSRELGVMAQSGRIVADTLLMLREHCRPGISTDELNSLAERFLQERHAVSSYIAVEFDGVVCVSINDEVVHGIPGPRALRGGDLVSLDIAAIHKGYHGDAAISFGVGTVSPTAAHLLKVTEGALALGTSLATPGRHLYDLSAAIQTYVEGEGLSVVRNLVGHGIGRSMWEEPQVPNYRQDERGPVLRPGMVFTIEPMINAGGPDVEIREDKWTIVTADHKLSAHFEHTIAITDRGARILTLPTNAAAVWAVEPPNLGGARRTVLIPGPSAVSAGAPR